jgi:hypothetical protein
MTSLVQCRATFDKWQGHGKQQFPEEILPLRLFKCSNGSGWLCLD